MDSHEQLYTAFNNAWGIKYVLATKEANMDSSTQCKPPVDSVVNEKLRYDSGNNGDADSKTKPATRSVKQPPQSDRHCRQC